MEIRESEAGERAGNAPQVELNITVSIVPFGCLEIKERHIVKPPSGSDEGPEIPTSDYHFPPHTPISSRIVATSQAPW